MIIIIIIIIIMTLIIIIILLTSYNGRLQTSKYYMGMTSNNFKKKYSQHLKSFCDKVYRNEIELSKHIWVLKVKKRDFRLKRSIMKHAAYRNGVWRFVTQFRRGATHREETETLEKRAQRFF